MDVLSVVGDKRRYLPTSKSTADLRREKKLHASSSLISIPIRKNSIDNPLSNSVSSSPSSLHLSDSLYPPRRQSESTFIEASLNLQKELDNILKDKASCKIFLQYLKSKRCEENFLFWMDVELFRMEEVTTMENIKEQATKIVDRYLREDACLRVNIDAGIVDNLIVKLDDEKITRYMFDSAQEDVLRLMETSCVTKYRAEMKALNTGIPKIELETI